MKHQHNISDIIEQNSNRNFITDEQIEELNCISTLKLEYEEIKNNINEIIEYYKSQNIIIEEMINNIDNNISEKIKKELEISNIVDEEKNITEEELLRENLLKTKQKLKDIMCDEMVDEYCEISTIQYMDKSLEKENLKKEIVELTNKLKTNSSPIKRRRAILSN